MLHCFYMGIGKAEVSCKFVHGAHSLASSPEGMALACRAITEGPGSWADGKLILARPVAVRSSLLEGTSPASSHHSQPLGYGPPSSSPLNTKLGVVLAQLLSAHGNALLSSLRGHAHL